jgi:hypothetical protein
MAPQTSIDSLLQQYQLWLELAEALQRAQAALLHGEIAAFERSTREQQLCCDRLLAWRQPDEASGSREASGEDVGLRLEIERVQREVRHLNRVHAALLRRASRSLQILCNLLMRSEPAYKPPPAQLPDSRSLASRG